MKSKKGFEIDFIGWLILGLITLVVILIIILWIKKGGVSQFNILKDLF